MADLREDGCHLLSVHTVGPSFPHDDYAATREFYRSTGFPPGGTSRAGLARADADPDPHSALTRSAGRSALTDPGDLTAGRTGEAVLAPGLVGDDRGGIGQVQ